MSEKAPQSAVDIVALLNAAWLCDPKAMHALVEHRVPCNDELADHPTIQVLDEGRGASVGLLGILNGIAGTNEAGTSGWVGAIYEGRPERLAGFTVVVR